jgi:hypothetical protein
MRATPVTESPLMSRVHYRFRLLDDAGNDLGPFATRRNNWTRGERLARWHGEELEVVAVNPADPTDPVVGYIVVRPPA